MRDRIPMPHKLGRYRGHTYWRYTVRVLQSDVGWQQHRDVVIVAESPAAAVNAVRDEFAPHVWRPTEFETAGPAGGITHRYVGWESLVGAKMFAERGQYEQLILPLTSQA